MSDSGDNVKYKWGPESTSLLVSVWSDRQVQKQLEYASKPQLIWESVARYMKKKGYNVSGKQCRSRMKQVLVCYREAKRAGTRAGVEQYYESIDRVLKNRRLTEYDFIGVDTVDSTANVKSPPKEVKTNKNLQMRHKFQEPVPTLHRTEALSPTWTLERESDYPNSPESNETIIARPYRVFSPTRDVAINTGEQLAEVAGKSMRSNTFPMEQPLHANYKHNLVPSYNYGEIPFQNTVQNVQNQIIQENMQQNQNLLCTRQNTLVNNLNLQQNMQSLNQGLAAQPINVPMQVNSMAMQNANLEHLVQQNQMQQIVYGNRAMPQEPTKVLLEQNVAPNFNQQYKNLLTQMPGMSNAKQTGSLSPDFSPDVSQNLNEAFCQTKNESKAHNLNETYNRIMQSIAVQNPEISVITNNATCNDESLLEFSIDSPTPSEGDNKSKNTAVNTDNIPNVPLRKKKAQKLEQLVLSAISSQNEVVNKILAAQNDMVTKFLDVDRDRQSRLENRLDDLLKVVHASMLPKSSSEEMEIPPPPPEPTITSLVPPPRPGAAPPKLDLVPPKPCRVPCTMPSSTVELINQNTVSTRPGVVSPIGSPVKKPGTIWSKLGPVSQSPFVKAQQRLGLQSAISNEARTQSSAERRIAREVDKIMDMHALIFETRKFLEAEKRLEEKIENARLESSLSETLNARRRLFSQREPTPAMILTAAFLENELRATNQLMNQYGVFFNADKKISKSIGDDLLSGQGESYDRLRRLNIQSSCVPVEPCNTSTPAKLSTMVNDHAKTMPKQTIQQLAQLVMSSGRWKEAGTQRREQNLDYANAQKLQANTQNVPPISYGETYAAEQPKVFNKEDAAKNGQNYVREWMMNKYEYPGSAYGAPCNQKPNFPMGFVKPPPEIVNLKPKEEPADEIRRPPGFHSNVPTDRKHNVRFMDEALAELQRMYLEAVSKEKEQMNDSLPYVLGNNGNAQPIENRQMIEKYIQEMMPRKQLKDKDRDKDTDSDNDEEFLDTTTSMPAIVPRRNSIASTGTASTDPSHFIKFTKPDNCVLS